jgi:tRNA isopentenyl-2-thiomethyl-A-37 hydroxylase MiaE
MESNVGKIESFVINRYAASELAGSILLGKMARKVKDTDLMVNLTRHCMEEARHAFVWYDLMKRIGIPIIEIHDSEGENYFSHVDKANDIIEFLAFTHIFEQRVPFHFELHAKWTKNPEVKKVLEMLIPEEAPHLSWIKEVLLKEIENGNNKIKEVLERYAKLEQNLYYEDLDKLEKMGGEAEDYAKKIKSHVKEFEDEPKWWQN